MPERGNPQPLKIGIRQVPQHLAVDRIVAERGHILLEPQTAKPGGDVHHSCFPRTRPEDADYGTS